MQDGTATIGVSLVRAGMDALLKSDLSALGSAELTALLGEFEVERRRAESVDQQLIAQLGERGVAGDYGRSSPADLLVELLRVSPGEARARVRRARDMGPRRELSGAPLEPILPLVAEAQRCGAISAGHAAVIVRVIDTIPAYLAAGFTEIIERALVEQAHHVDPSQVAKAGAKLLARIDQDGTEPRERETQRRRDWNLYVNPDGTGLLSGRLTAGACATWRPIIDALSAPRPAQDGEPDDRSPGQRRHDGFLEAGQRLLRSGTLPDCGGVPVTILVHLNADQLRERTGLAETAHGDLLPIAELLHLAAEADIVPSVLDDTGGILCYGRTRRLASPQQRLALALRDRGCCFPGCTRPPAWCEAHHVTPWLLGGPTDIANLCLLCEYHHREFEKRGWTVQITNGIPQWLPPTWLDAERKPRRNTAHHIAEFDFAASSPCG